MSAALDLNYNEDQQAIHAAVSRFCQQIGAEQLARQTAEPFSKHAWQQLAQLGVFAAASPGNTGAGGAQEICAASEALGTHVFPGPIGATYTAIQVLDTTTARSVIEGDALVSLRPNATALLPYGTVADIFLAADGDRILAATVDSDMEAVATLGGDIWGRASLQTDRPLANAARGWALGNIAHAAYLASLALRLIEDTAEHASSRKQFGKNLGDFQAVSHPLADCVINATAAQTLARMAACHLDNAAEDESVNDATASLACAALLSAADASQQTAFNCHQVFGAVGVTVEGPVFHMSRRVRQLISQSVDNSQQRESVLQQSGLGVQ